MAGIRLLPNCLLSASYFTGRQGKRRRRGWRGSTVCLCSLLRATLRLALSLYEPSVQTPGLEAQLEQLPQEHIPGDAHLPAPGSLCSVRDGICRTLGFSRACLRGGSEGVEEWTAVGRSYKGKGRGPSETVECRRARSPRRGSCEVSECKAHLHVPL